MATYDKQFPDRCPAAPRRPGASTTTKLAWSAVVLLCSIGSPAVAAAADEADAPLPLVPPEHRGGFTFGATLAPVGTGRVVAYPNKIDQLNDPRFEQKLSGALASRWGLFVGATPRDWMSVGLTFQAESASQNERVLAGGMVGLRFDGYPAYAWGGEWRNIGLTAEFGAGFASITDVDGNVLAEGGSLASIGVGAFWDAWRIWHLGVGPGLNYVHEESETMQLDLVTLNLRANFYGTLLQ